MLMRSAGCVINGCRRKVDGHVKRTKLGAPLPSRIWFPVKKRYYIVLAVVSFNIEVLTAQTR